MVSYMWLSASHTSNVFSSITSASKVHENVDSQHSKRWYPTVSGLEIRVVAAVDTQRLPGDVPGRGSDQEGDGGTDVVLRVSDTPERNSSGQSFFHRGFGLDGCGHG